MLNEDEIKNIEHTRAYGDNLGIAFQLIDDLLGIVGDPRETGKPVGSDLREGKMTLPINIAIELADEGLRSKILQVHGRPSSDEVMKEVVEGIKSIGIEERVMEIAAKYVKNSIDAIKDLPESDSKRSLEEIAQYAIRRKK